MGLVGGIQSATAANDQYLLRDLPGPDGQLGIDMKQAQLGGRLAELDGDFEKLGLIEGEIELDGDWLKLGLKLKLTELDGDWLKLCEIDCDALELGDFEKLGEID